MADKIYKVSLYNVGVDCPVAVYTGCTDYSTVADGKLYITRRNGERTVTNMAYIVEVE